MKQTVLYSIWVFLYILCALLGNVTDPTGAQSVALTFLSLIFFVPGVILLVDALRSSNRKTLLLLRWISGLSLGLTMLLVIGNIASVNASEAVGNFLHQVLNLVSVPMLCSQIAPLSLFLWACMLFASFPGKRKG